MKKAFVLFTSYSEQIKMMSNEQCGVLLKAIFAYECGEELPEMDGMVTMAFSFISAQLKRNDEKYAEISEKRKVAGAKGGRPKKEKQEESSESKESNEKQMLFLKAKKNTNTNVNEKEKEKVKEKEKRFTRPTLEEVEAYCLERNNTVDAKAFVDFYESKGWRVGNAPMKDWKACVRTWERRRDTRKATTFNSIEARKYDMTQLEKELAHAVDYTA